MESENIFKVPSLPNTPSKVLSQVSSDRINQQRIPQSPSLPSHISDFEKPQRHQRRGSDVRSIVAKWESGSQYGATPPASPTRANSSHAALQRAILGREEAEAQLSEAHLRERRISERVESLMEELEAVHTKLAHHKEVYEKEMKKARKLQFRSDSDKLMVESDLKEARSHCGRWKAEAERERKEKEKAKQEAFERAYVVAGLTEEVEGLKEKLRSVEKIREVEEVQRRVEGVLIDHEVPDKKEPLSVEMRSTAVQTEDAARAMHHSSTNSHRQTCLTDSSSRLASSAETQTHDQYQPDIADMRDRKPLVGQKQSSSRSATQLERFTKDDAAAEELIRELKTELNWAKTLHSRDEELIHFLQMQCQFKACSCRIAEMRGEQFVHDAEHMIVGNGISSEKNFPQQQDNEKMGAEARPFKKDERLVEHDSVKQNVNEGSTIDQLEEQLPDDHEDAKDESQLILADAPEQEFLERTPEPTALLEEMTQVLVQPEPLTGVKPFSFSTSTSSSHHQHFANDTFDGTVIPSFRSHSSAQASMPGHEEHGLFNLSPPKQAPPRPSTALGVSTVPGKSQTHQLLPSPIRVVPISPNQKNLLQRPATAMGSFTPPSQTRKIPLRNGDSNSPTKSSKYRPAAGIFSRSPTPAHISASASPNYPATPIVHPPISRPRPQSIHTESPAALETTTTTMIPLRGDDVFSPAPRTPATGSRTVPLSVNIPLSSSEGRMELVPGTPVSRQEALRQIRERRDRARSVHLKSSSGNAVGMRSAPGSVKRKIQIGRLAREDDERGRQMDREVSYASAPGGL